MPRPNWEDVDSYGFDPKTLSYRQYAWEFLRRSPAFQTESEEALISGAKRERERVATKYGLRDLVSYMHTYEPGEPELVWLAETLCELPIAHQKGQANYVHPLRPGEVALIFDLNPTLGSGPAAIDAFLWYARTLLIKERDRFIATLPTDGECIVRVKSPKIRKSKLFTWLRTYDAVMHMGVAQKDVARVLYPDDFVPDIFTKKTKELVAQKRVSDDRKRAVSLVDSEYLALIPLDYLQNKSKR